MPERMKKLLAAIDDLDQTEEHKFTEFDPDDIKAQGPAAVLIEWKGEEHWLPFSQLRKDDQQLYASAWILEKKGIEV